MSSLESYGVDGNIQIRRPVYVHEGPTGSWPGAVSPAEVRYEEIRRMEEQRNQQLGKQVECVAEVAAVLETAFVAR